MPPRHGKSELTSVWTPAWFLANWPHRRVILTSYAFEVAEDWGRRVRDFLEEHAEELNVRLKKDTRKAGKWNTKYDGGMLCAGAGGPITGKGADLFLGDDLVKNAEEALSAVMRKKTDTWWREVARTRLEPGATAVLIGTRWHEDDLIGRRKAATVRGDEHWHDLCIPAIANSDDDPLGRKIGEPLWPDRYPRSELASLKVDVGEYGWNAQFQGSPQDPEGGLFKADWFAKRYERTPDGFLHVPGSLSFHWSSIPRFVTIDPALKEREFTLEDAYSAAIVWGVAPGGELLVLDVWRDRVSSPGLVAHMKRTAEVWKPTAFWVEKQSIGTAVIQWARSNGIRCQELDADRDKATRALGAAPTCEAGRVLLPVSGHWLSDFIHELLACPTGTHWDQVDAFAYGVQVYDRHALASWPLWGEKDTPKRPAAATDVGLEFPEDRRLERESDDDEPPEKGDWLDGLGPRSGWRTHPW